MLETF